ncbi:MAG: hypothetical protein ACJA1F_002439 [Paracoccaceae bacterium]|jgi:hypothetical protein
MLGSVTQIQFFHYQVEAILNWVGCQMEMRPLARDAGGFIVMRAPLFRK